MSDVNWVKRPKAFLGDLSADGVPAYLQALARAGRIIADMAIYGNDLDRMRAAQVLEMAEEELKQANVDIRRELILTGQEGDDGADGKD